MSGRRFPSASVRWRPEEVGRFLTHLMENTHGDFWGGYDLQPKLQYLVGKPGDWDRLRNASLKLKLTV
jgi:hypothetical protein